MVGPRAPNQSLTKVAGLSFKRGDGDLLDFCRSPSKMAFFEGDLRFFSRSPSLATRLPFISPYRKAFLPFTPESIYHDSRVRFLESVTGHEMKIMAAGFISWH